MIGRRKRQGSYHYVEGFHLRRHNLAQTFTGVRKGERQGYVMFCGIHLIKCRRVKSNNMLKHY